MDNSFNEPFQNILKTDKNLIHLPIFSASKSSTPNFDLSKPVKRVVGDNIFFFKYNGGRVLTINDRKVLAGIEKLFTLKNKNLNDLCLKANKYVEEEVQRLRKEYKIDTLAPSEHQLAIYNATQKLSSEFSIRCTLGELNKILNDSKSNIKTSIKDSLKVMSQTTVLAKSAYFVDGVNSKFEMSSIPLIIYGYSEVREKNRKILSITMNPIHIWNIINKSFVYLDYDLFNSFRNLIACRLYEKLKPSLFSGKGECTFKYENLATYLGIKNYKTSLSRIKSQLDRSLLELKEKGVIYHFEYNRELDGGVSITFTNNPYFFFDYFKHLSKETQKAVLDKKAEIEDNPIIYVDLLDSVGKFMENLKIANTDDIDAIREYYLCYLISEEGLF